jgi:ABC-type sugar transport system ATPase subunit
MNLVDGEILRRNGTSLFKAGELFTIPIRDDKVEAMQKVSRHQGGRMLTRLGIRCEHIRLGREKTSKTSVQLPVYAIAHEADSSLVTFELPNCFLHVRSRSEKGFCDYKLSEKLWLDFDQDQIFFYRNTVDVSKV